MIAEATVRVVVLDPTQPLAEQQTLITGGDSEIVCINKVDQPALWKVDDLVAIARIYTPGLRHSEEPGRAAIDTQRDNRPTTTSSNVIALVAIRSEGVDALRQHLLQHFGCDDLRPDRPRVWTERQRRLLERVIA